jgi:hypothetical protein
MKAVIIGSLISLILASNNAVSGNLNSLVRDKYVTQIGDRTIIKDSINVAN